MSNPRRGDRAGNTYRTAGLLLAIPTLLIVSPIAGFFIGNQLDIRFGSNPWLTMIGLVLGFIAGARQTWLIYRRYQANEERERRR